MTRLSRSLFRAIGKALLIVVRPLHGEQALEWLNEPDQFHIIFDTHFLQNAAPVSGHRLLRDSKFLHDLFHLFARANPHQDFPFPERKLLHALRDDWVIIDQSAVAIVKFDSFFNALQQTHIVHRLFKEIKSSGLHGLGAQWHISMSSDDDDRKACKRQVEPLLKFHASHLRHANIEHQTAGLVFVKRFEEVDCGWKSLGF